MGTDVTEAKQYTEEIQNDLNARFFMISCKSNKIVHLFEDMKSAKAMWDVLEKNYGVMSPAMLCAIKNLAMPSDIAPIESKTSSDTYWSLCKLGEGWAWIL